MVAIAVVVPVIPLDNHRLTPLVDDDRLPFDIDRLLPNHDRSVPFVDGAAAQQQREANYTAIRRQTR